MARTPSNFKSVTADVDVFALVRRFELDPSSPYSMSEPELLALLGEVGEYEPIIDALMVLGGQSNKARAEAIGCRESDFD